MLVPWGDGPLPSVPEDISKNVYFVSQNIFDQCRYRSFNVFSNNKSGRRSVMFGDYAVGEEARLARLVAALKIGKTALPEGAVADHAQHNDADLRTISIRAIPESLNWLCQEKRKDSLSSYKWVHGSSAIGTCTRVYFYGKYICDAPSEQVAGGIGNSLMKEAWDSALIDNPWMIDRLLSSDLNASLPFEPIPDDGRVRLRAIILKKQQQSKKSSTFFLDSTSSSSLDDEQSPSPPYPDHVFSRPSKTSQPLKILIDPLDFPTVSAQKWYISRYGYATNTSNGSHSLHREIMKRMLGGPIPKGFVPDHLNNVKLDNRRQNHSLVSLRNNARNVEKAEESSNGYYGVSCLQGRYYAVIRYTMTDSKDRFRIGPFKTAREAGAAYLDAKRHANDDDTEFFKDLASKKKMKTSEAAGIQRTKAGSFRAVVSYRGLNGKKGTNGKTFPTFDEAKEWRDREQKLIEESIEATRRAAFDRNVAYVLKASFLRSANHHHHRCRPRSHNSASSVCAFAIPLSTRTHNEVRRCVSFVWRRTVRR